MEAWVGFWGGGICRCSHRCVGGEGYHPIFRHKLSTRHYPSWIFPMVAPTKKQPVGVVRALPWRRYPWKKEPGEKVWQEGAGGVATMATPPPPPFFQRPPHVGAPTTENGFGVAKPTHPHPKHNHGGYPFSNHKKRWKVPAKTPGNLLPNQGRGLGLKNP